MKNIIYWNMILITIETIVFLILFLFENIKTTSNVFFGISAVLMCGYIVQYFKFKSMNLNIKRGKLKISSRDKTLINIYLKNQQIKQISNNNYPDKIVIKLKQKQCLSSIFIITPPIIIAITIALITGFLI